MTQPEAGFSITRFDVLCNRCEADFDLHIVKHEDSPLITFIHWFLRCVLRSRANYGEFVTTVGRTMFVPNDFFEWHPGDQYELLRHERMHLKQFRFWPMPFLGVRGLWRINAVLMGFCYLFVLPCWWTLRARFEKEGYRESMLAACEMGDTDPANPTHVARWERRMEAAFGSSMYFFMARKGKGAAFARQTLEDIRDGLLVADRGATVDV